MHWVDQTIGVTSTSTTLMNYYFSLYECRQGCAPTQYDPELQFRAIRRLIHDTLVIAELDMLFGLQLFHREYDISELNLVNPVLSTKERPMYWPLFPPLQNNWCSDRTDDLKAMYESFQNLC